MRDNVALLKFGKRVQSLRHDQKISQEQLAELADLDRTYISSVERGQRNISILNILKIAGALNITASCLLNGIGGNDE